MSADTYLDVEFNTSDRYQVNIILPDQESQYEYNANKFAKKNFTSHVRKILNKNGIETDDKFEYWNISFQDEFGKFSQVEKSGQEALQLFAAVIKVTENFVKSKKPKVFGFSAKTTEASRVKLYDLLARKVKGYKLYTGNISGEKWYIFNKEK